jgi:DNA-binding GntR family transcriptional regulator
MPDLVRNPARATRKGRRSVAGKNRSGSDPAVRRAKPAAPADSTSIEAAAPPDEGVYAAIHEAILDHRLPPGTKLKEIPLAELFGVTRSVVRKALARLAHERVVELRTNRGAIVASPSVEESRNLFAARLVIESAIVDVLARSVTKAQVRELRALVQEENAAYQRGEVRSGLKLSREFHCVVARMAGNTVLTDFLEQLVARTPLVLLAYRGRSQHAGCANDEHAAITEAIAAGQAGKAVALLRTHLESLAGHLQLDEEEASTDLAAIFGKRR